MKLEYTTLFEEYTHAVERMIESAITAKVPVSLLVVIKSDFGNDAIPYFLLGVHHGQIGTIVSCT